MLRRLILRHEIKHLSNIDQIKETPEFNRSNTGCNVIHHKVRGISPVLLLQELFILKCVLLQKTIPPNKLTQQQQHHYIHGFSACIWFVSKIALDNINHYYKEKNGGDHNHTASLETNKKPLYPRRMTILNCCLFR